MVGVLLIIIMKTQVLYLNLHEELLSLSCQKLDSRKKKVSLLMFFLLFSPLYPMFYADLSMANCAKETSQ